MNVLRSIAVLQRYWRLRLHRYRSRSFRRRLQSMTRIPTSATRRSAFIDATQSKSLSYMDSLKK
jgi:hypothetical protein